MKFIRLHSLNDPDIEKIRSAFDHPSISRYISVDTDNYWRYITETENVYFYKIYDEKDMIAAIHCELFDKVLHIAVAVFPEYQNMGFGKSILEAIQKGNFDIAYNKIHASIEAQNIISLRLFEHAGFVCTGKDDGLFEYEYTPLAQPRLLLYHKT